MRTYSVLYDDANGKACKATIQGRDESDVITKFRKQYGYECRIKSIKIKY